MGHLRLLEAKWLALLPGELGQQGEWQWWSGLQERLRGLQNQLLGMLIDLSGMRE